jgi:hypothetical protein
LLSSLSDGPPSTAAVAGLYLSEFYAWTGPTFLKTLLFVYYAVRTK